jgi:hypothetical protein
LRASRIDLQILYLQGLVPLLSFSNEFQHNDKRNRMARRGLSITH